MYKKGFFFASALWLLLLSWCGAPKVIDDADVVNFEYALSFTDGGNFASW